MEGGKVEEKEMCILLAFTATVIYRSIYYIYTLYIIIYLEQLLVNWSIKCKIFVQNVDILTSLLLCLLG